MVNKILLNKYFCGWQKLPTAIGDFIQTQVAQRRKILSCAPVCVLLTVGSALFMSNSPQKM